MLSPMLNGRSYIVCYEETVLFCSLAVLDPRVGHTMDVLSLLWGDVCL